MAICMLIAYDLTGQTLPTVPSNDFDYASTWTNGNKGEYYNYEYDPCTGVLKFVFFAYADNFGNPDFMESFDLTLKNADTGETLKLFEFKYRSNFSGASELRLTGPTIDRTVYYLPGTGVSAVEEVYSDPNVNIRFEIDLGEDFLLHKNYLNMDVNWYDGDLFGEENTTASIINQEKASFTATSVEVPLVPTVARLSHKTGFQLSFDLASDCTTDFDSDQGVFYDVLRMRSGSVSEEKVMATEIPYRKGPTVYEDDVNIDDCDTYEYAIRAILINDTGTTIIGVSSYSSPIFYQEILSEPNALAATNDRCDGRIELSWEDSRGADVDGYLIYRKQPGEADFSLLTTLSASTRVYQDNIAEAFINQPIEYRIATEDKCGRITATEDLTEFTGTALTREVPPSEVTAQVIADGASQGIRIEWKDNSDFEDSYLITRQLKSGGGGVSFDVPANTTQFDDLTASICELYIYTVKLVNSCSATGYNDPDEVREISIDANLAGILTESSLSASRGYFSERVTLDWTTSGLSENISRFRIYSRLLGSTDEPIQIGVVNGAERTFDDEKSEAGEVFEYFLIGETDCGDVVLSTLSSDDMTTAESGVGRAIGFKSPTGVINGNIAYEGGNGVENVKVIVENNDEGSGYALAFENAQTAIIPDTKAQLASTTNSLSLSVYIKPDLTAIAEGAEASVLEKDESFRLKISDKGFLTAGLYLGGEWEELNSTAEIEDAIYSNIYVTYDQTTFSIFINGELNVSRSLTGIFSVSNTSDLILGDLYTGLIDELTVWDVARTAEEIERDYVRQLQSEEEGMIGYWPMRIGIGDQIFDAARSGNKFFGTDGSLNEATWSTDVPDANQLGTIGYTNLQGNYTISGIAFKGAGQNFQVTPVFGVHEFSPTQKFIFLGNGNLVQNGVDFTDISSFTVTGTVFFDFGDNTSGSEGVNVHIDGKPVFSAGGQLLNTNSFGQFEIQVPIGEHYIELVKEGHTFQTGRFPDEADELFNFNEPLSGLTFYDTTKRKLIGKVVGGTREGDKPVGFDRTINNIGQAEFVLKSTDETIIARVQTDAETGEYIVELPPKVYSVFDPKDSLQVGKMRVIAGDSLISSPVSQVDLLNNFNPSVEADTVLFTDMVPLPEAAVRVDTVDNNTREVRHFPYDYKVNFVYRNTPQVFVFDGSRRNTETRFLGESEFVVPARKDSEADTVDLYNEALVGDKEATDANVFTLGYPVVFTDSQYKLRIGVNEVYVNRDSGAPVTDQVPVTDAAITVDSDVMAPFYYNDEGQAIAYSQDPALTQLLLNSSDGDTLVRFSALTPEFATNANTDISFTREFKITVNAGGNVVNWPDPNDQNAVQRLYVFGHETTSNTSFVTSGPEVVDFIIRDPYGGESFAYLEKGTTLAVTKTYTGANSLDLGLEFDLKLGTDNNNVTSSTDFTYTSAKDSSGNTTDIVTTTQRIETRSDAQEVGAGGDLYVSSSRNYRAGLSKVLRLVDADFCSVDGPVACLEGSKTIVLGGKNYKLGRTVATTLEQDGAPTYFVYTQNHILNTLIPDLKNARNSVLVTDNRYESVLPTSDPNYGVSNDDTVWGLVGNDYQTYDENIDDKGDSYLFTRNKNDEVDTVYWINQQIRLWQEAVAQNEKEKADAFATDDFENISISAGARLSREKSTTFTDTKEVTYSTTKALTTSLETNFEALAASFKLAGNLSVTEQSSEGTISDSTVVTTYGFELFEPDVGDFVSMNVYDGKNGSGPIFILAGGETSCPHEEAVTTQFYLPGTQIGSTTFQRDKPRLDVDVSQLYNVPADGQAAFNFTLFNDSESQDDFLYSLSVIDESNPSGAVVSMDGEFFDARRELFVPGNSAIRKVITVERGPFEYNYEDIKIVMASVCQSDPTDFERVIADTVSISAFFLPVCTTPELITPSENWILNSSFESQMEFEIGGFDINFPGFQYVQLEYKRSGTSGWLPIQRFYRNLSDAEDPDTALEINKSGSSTFYKWDVSQIPDGDYDLRVISDCEVLATGGEVTSVSGISSGTIDRVNPHLFGLAEPADGVLSPGDVISLQFNEPINAALLTPSNFSVKGVLNGGTVSNNVAVSFDGTGNESVLISNAPDLRSKNFTIDFWARREATGAEILLHQGATVGQKLQIGFDADNQPYLEMNEARLTADFAVTNTGWNHYSFVYNREQNQASLIVATASETRATGQEDFVVDYQVAEALTFGKSSVGETQPFNGLLHSLRIWSKTLSETEIAVNRNISLSGNTTGLLACWPLDEGKGDISLDKVKSRQAQINASWRLDPAGVSVAFNGSDQFLQSNGIAAFSAEQDFTIEMWLKTSSAKSMTMFSNGSGDGIDDNAADWTIGLNNGQVTVENDSATIETENINLADGSWHHLTVVVNRTTNTQIFVDGELRVSVATGDWPAFANDLFWYGRRSWKEAGVLRSDQYFEGNLDEIRIWNSSRSQREILFNQYNKLNGDEIGLIAYYPFERFDNSSGAPILTNTLLSGREDAGAEATLEGSPDFANDAPPVRQPRPLQSVNFSYSANQDRIVITPIEDNERIENVILNIGVKGIRDLRGNQLRTPLTWTAFVDRNDVEWINDDLIYRKPVNEPFTFETEIVNNGGQRRSYSISNLPAWLSVSDAQGSLEPGRTKTILFTVDASLNIGDYDEFIHLSTDFGFDERLNLQLAVYKDPPADWTVNAADFQSSMSVVSQIQISEVFSRDENDLIAAFVDGEIRGVTALKYISSFDNYQAFLSVYTNNTESTEVTYKIWDASEGTVYPAVIPSKASASILSPDAFIGSPSDPVIFNGDKVIEETVSLSSGWSWVSFNLESEAFKDLNTLFENLNATENDQIKGTEFFDQYDPVNGWLGSLSANGGLQKERMYKVNLAGKGEISYVGKLVDVVTSPIDLAKGWNWVSFFGRSNQTIDEALSNITNLSVGDRIKGQREFAIYGGAGVGWVGSLASLKPGEGYLYFANEAGTLTYPELSAGISNIGSTAGGQSLGSEDRSIDFESFGLNPADYETNMNLVVKVEPVTVGSDDMLVAKSDEKVVGLGYASPNPVTGERTFFITIYGTTASEIEFELLKGDASITLKAEQTIPLSYKADTQLGSLVEPVMLISEQFLPESVTAKAVPNPFEENMRLSWFAEAPPHRIQVMNTEGMVMQELNNLHGNHQDIGFGGMAQGMYLIRLHFEQQVLVLKVVKSK